jgi:hypothetical protein
MIGRVVMKKKWLMISEILIIHPTLLNSFTKKPKVRAEKIYVDPLKRWKLMEIMVAMKEKKVS